MKLPFFYPEHPEFKAHVKHVTDELWRFYHDADDLKLPYTVAEKRAKDIVLHITSRPVPWWERLIDHLRGRQGAPVDDMFEAGLERYLREAIERAESQTDEQIQAGAYTTQADVTAAMKRHLCDELALDAQR